MNYNNLKHHYARTMISLFAMCCVYCTAHTSGEPYVPTLIFNDIFKRYELSLATISTITDYVGKKEAEQMIEQFKAKLQFADITDFSPEVFRYPLPSITGSYTIFINN